MFEPVELLYSDFNDAERPKIEGNVGVFKGMFYPKEIGRYQFMVMSRSNMMEHRSFSKREPATLEEKFLFDYAPKDDVVFKNGWVHADFSLLMDKQNVLQNRRRVDGIDTLPNNWNVGFFNVTKNLSKKGVPFVYSLLGNKGWKATLIDEQGPILQQNRESHEKRTRQVTTKALWKQDGEGNNTITELGSLSPSDAFSQEVALYVKEPTSDTFRPVNCRGFHSVSVRKLYKITIKPLRGFFYLETLQEFPSSMERGIPMNRTQKYTGLAALTFSLTTASLSVAETFSTEETPSDITVTQELFLEQMPKYIEQTRKILNQALDEKKDFFEPSDGSPSQAEQLVADLEAFRGKTLEYGRNHSGLHCWPTR